MPHLHLSVSLAPGGQADPAELARQLTALTARHLDKDPGLTAVRLSLVPATQWFIATQPLSDLALASYHLEVQVTAGTNTERQIDCYLRAVHAELATLLGPLHATSYAVVQQLPAAAWGYGGLSQEARRLARQPEIV